MNRLCYLRCPASLPSLLRRVGVNPRSSTIHWEAWPLEIADQGTLPPNKTRLLISGLIHPYSAGLRRLMAGEKYARRNRGSSYVKVIHSNEKLTGSCTVKIS